MTTAAAVFVILVAVGIMLRSRSSKTAGSVERSERERRRQRAAELQAAGDVDGAIRELVAAGKKIEAIKLYRRQYSVGLKEAKDAVEATERQLRSG